MADPRRAGGFSESTDRITPVFKPVPTTVELKPPAPVAGFTDQFNAARRLAVGDVGYVARDREHDAWGSVIEPLGLGYLDNPVNYGESHYGLDEQLPVLLTRGAKTRAEQEQHIVDLIGERRKTDPKFLPGVPGDVEGLRTYIQGRLRAPRERDRATLATADNEDTLSSSSLAQLAGGIVGSFADPVNIATAPFGGGGKTLAQVALRETLVNGAITALSIPGMNDARGRYGEDKMTVAEAGGHILAGAAGGAVLGSAFHGAGKGLDRLMPHVFEMMPDSVQRRWADRMTVPEGGKEGAPHVKLTDVMADMNNGELAAFARKTIKPEHMTPDEKLALGAIERNGEISATSPFEPTPGGEAAHNEGLTNALDALLENRAPTDPSPSAEAAPDPLAPLPEGAPAGTSTPAGVPLLERAANAVGFSVRKGEPMWRGFPRAVAPPRGSVHPQLGSLASELEARGIPPHVARGSAAGVIAESRGNINATGPITAATKGQRAFGLGQWLFARADKLRARYGDAPTRAQQLDYLAWELKGGDAGGSAVLAAKDEASALNAYIRKFMRPGEGPETNKDLARGLQALGRGAEDLPAAGGAAAGGAPIAADVATDPLIAQLRAEALQLDNEVVGLTRMPDGELRSMTNRSALASELGVDADRFQFKSGGDQFGVTDRLQGVKEWDSGLAGRVIAWEDEAGKLWIADGHQRHGLARRIGAETGTDVRMDVSVLREKDGISAEDARVWAALKNISEGTGSAVDAAKVLRDYPHALDRLPPKSPLVRDGGNLARLSDDAFGAVYNERIPADQAAVVGELLPNEPEKHAGMVDLLIKADPANRAQARSIVRQAIAAGFHDAEQIDLFGTSSVSSPLFLEKAKVLERGLARLRKMRLVHKTAAGGAEELEAAGSKIAKGASEREAQANAQAIELIDRLAYRPGAVADALGAAARELANGGRLGDVTERFAKAVRELDLAAIAREDRVDDAGSLDADGAGRAGDAGEADADLFGEPSPPSLAELEAATERFSDPDGPAVKQQADSLVHDFMAAITDGPTAEELAGVNGRMAEQAAADPDPRIVKPGEEPWTTEDYMDAVRIIDKELDDFAVKQGKELEFTLDGQEAIEAKVAKLLNETNNVEAAQKLVRKELESGRADLHESTPEEIEPKPMPKSTLIPEPERTVRAGEDLPGAKETLTPEAAAAKLEEWKAEAKRIGQESPPPANHVILSLFDASGQWSQPYRDMGYQVIQLDLKHGHDLMDVPFIQLAIDGLKEKGGHIAGVIAQPPCTTFAASGARWWAPRHNKGWRNAVRKMFGEAAADEFNSPVEYNQFLVAVTEEYIARAKPDFYVMENPVGRIEKMTGLPKPLLTFDPHNFGDPYTKRTHLYGQFNPELQTANVDPAEGSRMHKLRSRDEKDEGLRSLTSEPFAYAFALANRPGTEARVAGAAGEAVLHDGESIIAKQRGATLEDLISRAKANQPELEKIGGELAGKLEGVEFIAPPKTPESPDGVKGIERTRQKLENEGYLEPGELKDLARATFTVDSLKQADAVVAALRERGLEIHDKGWKVIDRGYRDRKLIVQFPNGGVAEIQVLPRAIADYKFGESHALYERARDPKTPFAEKEQLRETMRAKYQELLGGTEFEALGKDAAKSAELSGVPSSSALRTSDTEAGTQALPLNSDPASGPSTTTARSSSSKNRLMAGSSSLGMDLPHLADPGKAAADRQLGELGAAAPLRAAGDVDQLGEIGLKLFDKADQNEITFRLDEEGDEISGKDLLAELEADKQAIETLRGCL